jgi:type II secretory pathway pseudopilin PulG
LKNNNGFLMIDSMLAVLTFTILVTVLLPGALMLQQMDHKSTQLLNFHRQLYLEISRYETYEDFIKNNKQYAVNRGEICDKSDKNLCFKKK